MIDYEFLRIIWWVLVIVLLIGFSVTDGFDMGVTALLPVAGKKEVEKRIMINSIAPHWDGNQVWLLTAGGAIFAAWPIVYSVAFSGFYIALFLVLAALFFRPIGFEYRAKIDNPTWRAVWDWGLFAGGFVPALVFGVAFGNLLQDLYRFVLCVIKPICTTLWRAKSCHVSDTRRKLVTNENNGRVAQSCKSHYSNWRISDINYLCSCGRMAFL